MFGSVNPITLDGITGPAGECTCSHCQMDQLIDGLMAPATVAVVEQVYP